jgi:hypothetical protein
MAFLVWPPSPDPRDYQDDAHWEAKRAAAQERPPVRTSIRMGSFLGYVVAFAWAFSVESPARQVLFGLSMVFMGLPGALAKWRPVWALQPQRAGGGGPGATDGT